MTNLKLFQNYRSLHPGMGQAVAERTYLRRKENGEWENWGDVAHRVSLGNTLLCHETDDREEERLLMKKHMSTGTLLMSGRHLQHGDENQPTRPMEVYTNCSTSATSFILFYLLLNGCFSKGTLVKLSDGTYKPIELIQSGDVVVSWDEENKIFVNQRVVKLNINQPKPMVRITLENGEKIVCTFDHKFLTVNGDWVMAKDLLGLDVKIMETDHA